MEDLEQVEPEAAARRNTLDVHISAFESGTGHFQHTYETQEPIQEFTFDAELIAQILLPQLKDYDKHSLSVTDGKLVVRCTRVGEAPARNHLHVLLWDVFQQADDLSDHETVILARDFRLADTPEILRRRMIS